MSFHDDKLVIYRILSLIVDPIQLKYIPMFNTSIRTLIILATLIWHVGAVMLLLKGSDLLHQAVELRPGPGWPVLAVAAAILTGSLKGRFLFRKLCRRNLDRIAGLSQPKIWKFYRTRFFFFLGLMILTGATMSRLAEGNYILLIAVGWFDLSLCTALLVGSTVFWQRKNLS